VFAVTKRDGGQALVEFALVIPIFLLILFAIIQLGLLFSGQNSLVAAVRETARYAAPYRVVDSSGASTTCITVLGKLGDALASNPLTANPGAIDYSPGETSVTYTWLVDPDGTYFVQVTVKGAYEFPLYVPLVGNFLDGMDGVSDSKLRMSAQEEMRIENDPLASSSSTYTCPVP